MCFIFIWYWFEIKSDIWRLDWYWYWHVDWY